MRLFTIALLGLVLAPATAAVAGPNDSKKKKNDTVDVSAYRDQMVVLHSGTGHYVIAVPASGHYTTVFYGDGKVFYQQRTFGGGLDTGAKSMSASFWSPRVDHVSRVEQSKGAWQVQCGKNETALEPLAAEAAKKLLDKAVFRKHPWKYQAYALARDEHGKYYYVDRLRDEFGGMGFRLWVGPKSNMKRMRMTNIVNDSEGDIFATKKGELRMILSKQTSTWVKGQARTNLVQVPVTRNLPLIYGELGVYLGELYTPCDHF
jgi:hypothetical protein